MSVETPPPGMTHMGHPFIGHGHAYTGSAGHTRFLSSTLQVLFFCHTKFLVRTSSDRRGAYLCFTPDGDVITSHVDGDVTHSGVTFAGPRPRHRLWSLDAQPTHAQAQPIGAFHPAAFLRPARLAHGLSLPFSAHHAPRTHRAWPRALAVALTRRHLARSHVTPRRERRRRASQDDLAPAQTRPGSFAPAKHTPAQDASVRCVASVSRADHAAVAGGASG